MDLATFALLLSNLTAIANVEGDSNVYIGMAQHSHVLNTL